MSTTNDLLSGLIHPPLGLVKAKVRQQCQQHQLRPQLLQAVEAADPQVVADETDDSRYQGLIGGSGEAFVYWGSGAQKPR